MRDILEDAEGAAERGDVGPGKANRERDKQSFPKRFYKEVSLQETGDGHAVALDGKLVKTPGKQVLELPTAPAAQLLVEEWRAIEHEIDPLLLPVTRIANTAIDGVANEIQAVMEDVIRYAGSDLLCYRADTPEGLVANQQKAWDPILDWYAESLGARFELASGIVHVPQPKEAIAAFSARLKQHEDAVRLACIHTFTSISGSALLALALAEKQLEPEDAWLAAHIDEDWNISQWGEDWEAKERRAQRKKDFEAAGLLLRALEG